MVSVVVRGILVQLATPDEMRGRVNAVDMIFIGASNELGAFESGVTAQWLGAVPAVSRRRRGHRRHRAVGLVLPRTPQRRRNRHAPEPETTTVA